MKYKRICGIFIVIAPVLLFSKKTLADYCVSSPATPMTQALGTIAVSSTLPLGSDIPGSERNFTFTGNCSGLPQTRNIPIISCYYGSGTELPGYPGVYSTGVTGIGIAIRNRNGTRVVGAGSNCDTRNTPLGQVSNDASLSFSYNVTLALVKVSNSISSGVLSQAQTRFGMGVYNTSMGIGNAGPNNYLAYSGNVSFKSVTCSVGPDNILVELEDASASLFTGPGSTAKPKNFNVVVSCNDVVNVSMFMDAPGYISQSNGVIALTASAGNASGIGIQILYNNNPVYFGQFLPVGAVASAGSPLNIPLTARYYQSSSPVLPGIANATATVTMAYQ